MKKKFLFIQSLSLLILLISIFTKNTSADSKETHPRIAMVSISTPNRYLFSQYTLASFIKYAADWSYDFHLYTKPFDNSRPTAWGKIKAMLELLNTNKYDWCVWIDDDIYITNPSIPLEKFIQEYGKTAHLIISAQKCKPITSTDINTGLFFIKNSEWSKDLLQKIWDIGNNRYNKETGSFWEQSALAELMETKTYKDSPYIARIPARIIQSLLTLLFKGDTSDQGQWQPGDFAAHLAGANEDIRVWITKQFEENIYEYPRLLSMLGDYTIKQ